MDFVEKAERFLVEAADELGLSKTSISEAVKVAIADYAMNKTKAEIFRDIVNTLIPAKS